MYLSRTQACGRLNISPPTLLKHIRAGEIEAIKLGDARNSPVKVLITSIEAYEARQRMCRTGAAA
ncbi:helix-turn-helix domain-containing protein [Nonomuraea wenchangensis]|uniref:DNA binding domain-containing protein, excisionase family n=1 Tax=Nonomuraea wenchangensis TaxID=568860 RepID=A0A1I0F2B4_9ACTN|nr:helix-turn-helix domain-containing protein [Nonomuraea wenchangensis]SET51939.1 DNA binding domain-containing protein, excisionase family [Nonomuraea wenchangensis]